jgi:hypothetical protein
LPSRDQLWLIVANSQTLCPREWRTLIVPEISTWALRLVHVLSASLNTEQSFILLVYLIATKNTLAYLRAGGVSRPGLQDFYNVDIPYYGRCKRALFNTALRFECRKVSGGCSKFILWRLKDLAIACSIMSFPLWYFIEKQSFISDLS